MASSVLDPLSTPLDTPSPSFSSLPSVATTLQQLDAGLAHLAASDDIAEQLRRLASFRAPETDSATLQLSSIPKSRLASVLILLHLSRDGATLEVTLTTRSQRLRSHPGETSLPGGKFEPLSDTTIEETALREAHEEISLPLPPTAPLLHLTNLSPYTSRTLLLVVPCVYILLSPPREATSWLQDHLRPSPEEVEAIFDCSLTSLLLLGGTGSVQASGKHSASIGSKGENQMTYSFTDYSWPLSPTTPYRLHSFSHPRRFSSPITGLTADILIDTASIAHFGPGRGLSEAENIGFARRAEGQVGWEEICERALRIERTKRDPGRGVEVIQLKHDD